MRKPSRESAAALLLLALLACGPALLLAHPRALLENFRSGYAQARPERPTAADKLAAAIAGAENAAEKAVAQQTAFITLYGGFQRLTGCEIVQDASQDNNVARLKNGKLNFVARDAKRELPDENAAALNDFAAYNGTLGVPTLFVLAPQKIGKFSDVKPAGAVEYGNENSDRFLGLLSPEVGALDLRPVFRDAEGGHDAYFFDTDHHWTPEGAFLAGRAIAARLRADYGFTPDPEAENVFDWRKITYEDCFLGSQGKRVGPLYAGLDDFTLLLPLEETDGFSFEIPHKGVLREGSFEDAFLFEEMLASGDLYHANPYAAYTGGDYPLSVARNGGNPSGKKILLLRQSFSCALAPFLSRACSELDIIDPRYYDGSVREYVADTRPDLVLVVYAASDTCNGALFEPLSR